MTNSKNIPKRRFKEFGLDAEWELKKLGDLGSVEMCKRIFKYETSDKYEIPFYKIGTFGKQADSYISKKKFEIYKNSFPYPKKGDLLISASGSIGNVVEYRGEDAYFQDSNIVWLNHSGRVCNTFLKQFYSIASWEGIEGTTIKRLYNKNILETKIFLPTIQEQQVIGKFFQTIDSLITLHQHKLDKLKNLKKSYLAELFPAEGERVPKRRFPGFEGEWEEKKLEEVVEKFDNLRIPVASKDRIAGNIPYYGANGIQDYVEGFTHDGEFVLLAEDGANDLKDYPVQYVNGKVWVNNHSHVIQGKNNLIDNKFLLFAIKQIQMEPYLVGGGRAKLNAEIMMNLPLTAPGISEQRMIGEFLMKVEKQISLQQEKLDKLKDLKKAYLNELFV